MNTQKPDFCDKRIVFFLKNWSKKYLIHQKEA